MNLGIHVDYPKDGDDFQNFSAYIRHGVGLEVGLLAPGEDLEPRLLMQIPGGDVVVAALGQFLGSEELKDLLGDQVMPALIRDSEAARAAWLTFAWHFKAEDEEQQRELDRWRDAHGGSFAGFAGVTEEATMWVGDFTGAFEMWRAEVDRSGENGKVSLGEWEMTHRAEWFGDSMSGRFVTSAMLALVGSPTQFDISMAAHQLALDPEIVEALAEAADDLGIAGVNPNDLDPEERKRVLDELEARFPKLHDRIKEGADELLGPPSPIMEGRAKTAGD